ncbi:hypothetical protein [Sphingomonas quercus]|uniref:SnoaL-like domain-containing protein n=1 Tax=Sphingomonas quercus TaxID=2842451 RepID=A0ABS6BGP2_9SPHN|nr:hypothetical protein [Sphingomonas quercus]MBU3077460.1 hypothetical protein [Sphingomonas quercus]
MRNCLVIALALGACHAAPSAEPAAQNATVSAPAPQAGAAPVPAPDSAEAAAAVVQLYYAAIAAGDYAAAYRQWADGGRASRQDEAGFRKGFADTRAVRATLGPPGTVEGAAGSLYVTVPVTVEAALADGTRQRFIGSYVLRRVNDVPGATAEQRRWHIQSADLRADQAGRRSASRI